MESFSPHFKDNRLVIGSVLINENWRKGYSLYYSLSLLHQHVLKNILQLLGYITIISSAKNISNIVQEWLEMCHIFSNEVKKIMLLRFILCNAKIK
jgi:hypothetical protein